MRRSILVLAVLAGGAIQSQAMAVTTFQAILNGAQENPPVITAASGFGTAELNDAQTRLLITIQLFGLDLDGLQTTDPNDDVVAMHIHRAPIGANGPVIFGFISPDNDLNGDLTINAAAGTVASAWDLNEGNNTTLAAELPNLFANGLYFNVHTPSAPSGEIRGQITLVPEPVTPALVGLSLAGIFGAGWRRR